MSKNSRFSLLLMLLAHLALYATDRAHHPRAWHNTFPTIGLQKKDSPCYPFLPHLFTLHELAPQRGKNVRVAMIDTGLQTLHGSHAYNLIAGSDGIAPDANVIMLKAFDDQGMSKKKTIIKAVQKAREKHADILLMSLKIDDVIDPQSPGSRMLEQELGTIPYVIAASGNDGYKYHGGFPRVPCALAYPARFATTTFSVGSFGMTSSATVYVPAFSQYEVGIGPDFILPGVDVLAPGLPGAKNPRKNSRPQVGLSGTSTSAALLAGFLALMLGEYKTHFSHDQICAIMRSAALRLDDTPSWRRASSYGTLDMRMALFMARVLKAAKPHIKQFDKQFTKLLAKLRNILISPAQDYADKHFNGISFTKDFMNYVKQAHINIPFQDSNDLAQTYAQYTLEAAVDLCVTQLTGRSHKQPVKKSHSQRLSARPERVRSASRMGTSGQITQQNRTSHDKISTPRTTLHHLSAGRHGAEHARVHHSTPKQPAGF